ncbi:hypothetical protein H920_08769 [Fukomys damarensis]|uniref:Uncharacterized protein n=1 Tax=Fukomys damarensis TaxID=885580 RepID=A0A091DFF0_FUKDA|nr:hypothetical protein H920_08769 [Fukomys damarensis]
MRQTGEDKEDQGDLGQSLQLLEGAKSLPAQFTCSYLQSWPLISDLHLKGLCQCLAEEPSLQGRHTAVIKSLVEE